MAQTKFDLKYDITQSPLYKLRNKKKLASLLNLSSVADLTSLTDIEVPYRKFTVMKKGKPRPVEAPCRQLLPIHNRLFILMRRIHFPDYLHSCVKGRSYVSNAKAHRGSNVAYTLDLKKFYPSVSRAKVAGFFRDVMKCSEDVAGILANITTCDGHIPTGSALSQILAYLSCKEMFDTLFTISTEANLKMTCYVDDLTFSGDKLTKKWVHERIKSTIKRFGMNSHKDKYFGPGHVKEITGVIVDGVTVKVRNCMHKTIYDLIMQIAEIEDTKKLDESFKTLIGTLSAAGQIDDKFKQQRKVATINRRKIVNKVTRKVV